MLEKTIAVSIKNRLFVIVAAVMLLAAGAYVASDMDIDVFPDLTAPTVVVMTDAHSMAPEEVERLVSFPIETAVNGATNVRRVRSASAAGFSLVWVEFAWGTDIFRARQIVSEKLGSVAERMPAGVGAPGLAPQSSIMGEVLIVGLTADSTSLMDLRTIAEWTIRPALLSTGGVSQVTIIGGEYKQYQILADPQKMKYFGVTLADLLHTCEGLNGNAAGGRLNEFGNEYLIRGIVRTSAIDQIESAVVPTAGGSRVQLRDIAEVKIGAAQKTGDASISGEYGVLLTVLKQPSVNTIKLTRNIEKALESIRPGLPPDLRVQTDIFRQADFIEASVGNVRRALIEGAVFVVFILLIFLMNFRTTFITLVAIPLSLIISLLVLRWLGYTINTMSLGGMAIAIGALVDDAIIVVDNAYRRLRQNAVLDEASRADTAAVILASTREIMASIVNATFIIIVAFIPLFFLSGMEGRMLRPLGVSFIVSLFASLIVAITVTPALSKYLLTNPRMLKKHKAGSWLVSKLSAWYEKALTALLPHRKPVLLLSAVLVISAIATLPFLGRSFLPEFNEGSLTLSAVCMPGVSLDESNKVGNRIETTLMSIPEVKSTARRTGRGDLDEHALGVNSAEIDAVFKLDKRTREDFLADVRGQLAVIPGVAITVGQPLGHRIDHMLSGTRANIAIKLFGTDLNRMFALANEVKASIAGVEGLVDVNVDPQIDIPQIQIKPRREMLARYGITLNEFTEFVDVAFGGEPISEIFEGNGAFNLVLRYSDNWRTTIDGLRGALIDTRGHGRIPLEYVADVVSTTGPSTINRENVQRKIVIAANVAGRDLDKVVSDIKKNIAEKVRLPENYRIELGGQFESAERASRLLLFTSLAAIGIIFLLLYLEFRNSSLAAIILLNLPLALIGGVFSLWLTSGVLSIPAIIGFITLFGIATRNGILLVSNYENMRERNRDKLTLAETVIRGSKERLSPILMTALCAALALIPLALNGEATGNEIQSPMAKVILGGLLTSTLLNLFVVPIVYNWYRSKKGKETV